MFLVKRNCAEIYKSAGKPVDGVYTIKPDNFPAFNAFCDQTTEGGGWTVFQKRLDGSVDFYRYWNDYKRGFGDLCGEFWLGLDKIHRLTSDVNNVLRVDLEDFERSNSYAEYKMLVSKVRRTSTSWSLVRIQVELLFRLFNCSHSKKGGGGERRVLSNVNMLKLFNIIQ